MQVEIAGIQTSTAQTTREDVPTKILPDRNNRNPTPARLLFVDTWLSNGQQKVWLRRLMDQGLFSVAHLYLFNRPDSRQGKLGDHWLQYHETTADKSQNRFEQAIDCQIANAVRKVFKV